MENYHVVKSTKSVGLGILLTLLLGPIGLFYSTVWGGIIMTFGPVLLIVLGFLGMSIQSEFMQLVASATLIIYLLLWWLICLVWSVIAVNQYNRKIMSRSIYNTPHYPVRAGTESPSYIADNKKQLPSSPTHPLDRGSFNQDVPNIQDWLRANPDKGINDYYIKFRK
jgi:hypothetical protein